MLNQPSISEFMIAHTSISKTIASTMEKDHLFSTKTHESSDERYKQCQDCERNIEKVGELRKKQIQLQYENTKLNEQIQKLQKDKGYLIERLEKLEKQRSNPNVKSLQFMENVVEDLQSQLFQCKFINQILHLKKQATKVNSQLLTPNYSKVLLENFQLHQQVAQLNKTISHKEFYPLYHENIRFKFLRDNLKHFSVLLITQIKQIRGQLMSIRQTLNHFSEQFQMLSEKDKKIIIEPYPLKQSGSQQRKRIKSKKMKQN